MKIVHIIPTYNERENIGLMIRKIFEVGKRNRNWKNEILVVDDFSPDKTADEVRKIQKKHKGIHLIMKKKEGLGKALIQGYEYAMKKNER